nr:MULTISPECIES: lysylphosphatidylglycerol synthase transmembrane domain-containing protein [unclassified Paenibacillus]
MCITLVFLCYIILKVNWSVFYSLILDINISFLVLGVMVYIGNYILRAVRLKVLLQNKNIKVINLLGINFIHNFYNRILPARLGDFTLIYLLKKYSKESINSSVNIFILIKIYDLLISMFLLAISYTVLYKINIIGWGIWLLTLLILVLSLKPSSILSLIQIVISKYTEWNYIDRFNSKLVSLIHDAKQLEINKIRLYLFLTSLGIWFLIAVLFYILLLSINQNFGIWDTLFATTLANFSWVLPINGIGGFGTMEVSMAYAFSMRGHLFNEVLVSALYINVIVFILSTLFVVIPYYMLLKRRTLT